VPCGLAVDWVRSCHRGTFRLFKDRPEILTRGRFFFVPDDTPFLEGFHNYYSAEWTQDREVPYTPPALGEDLEKRLGYSPGILGVLPLPDAVLVGSAKCVSEGDSYPPAVGVPPRRLIAGIDSRCWLTPPAPVPPAFWWRSDHAEIDPGTGKIGRVRDMSRNGFDLTQVGEAFQPTLFTDPGLDWPAMIFLRRAAAPAQFNSLVSPVGRLFNAHTVYLVCSRFPGAGLISTGINLLGNINSNTPRVTRATVTYITTNGQGIAINSSFADGTGHLWCVRRAADLVRVYRDGILLGSSAMSAVDVQSLTTVTLAETTGSTVWRATLFEVRGFYGELDDFQHDTVTAELMTYYAIP